MSDKSQTIDKDIDSTLNDSKAIDVVKLHISEKSSLCDFLYICNGTSSRHTKSIADNIVKRFKDLGHPSIQVEGDTALHWIVIDLGDAIIHVFQKEAREKYRLEEIWK